MKYIYITLLLATMNSFGQLVKVDYSDGNQKLEGFFAKAQKANPKKIGVIILPAWMGVDAHSKESAEALAKLGYHAFVADIYGVGNNPKNTGEAGKNAGFYKNNPAEYQKRIQLAIDQLVKAGADKNQIAVIGYCFGGTGALEVARGKMPVSGIVSIHGGIGKDAARKNEAISTKMLIENGADDESITPENYNSLVTEMKEGKADWQIITYANSKHTFTNPESPDYNAVMSKRAWNHTMMFLKEILK